MKKSVVLTIAILLLGGSCLSAQDSLSNGKAFNFPFRKYGISLGNSYKFTGIRMNFADKNVKRINGLNVTFWVSKLSIEKYPNNYDAVVNGITLGVIPVGGSMQPISIGLIGIGAKKLNGLNVGGLNIHSFGSINGLSISGLAIAGHNINGICINGLWTESSVISGLAFSGFIVGAYEAVNGLAVGGFGIESEGEINGIAASLAYLGAQNYHGIGITPGYLRTGIYKGLAIAGYANTDQFHGLSVALYNRTDELHGFQIGLLNFAGNNRKGLKMLPLINLHLRKNKS
jgi:hypothetical protein